MNILNQVIQCKQQLEEVAHVLRSERQINSFIGYREMGDSAVVLNLWVMATRKHAFLMVLGTPNHKLVFVATS